MESYARPLRHLAERAAWFARAHELRLLHVVASADVRGGAVDVVMAQEFHADNRSPFIRLDAPYTFASAGWDLRAEALRQQHEARRAAMARHGLTLPALPGTGTGSSLPPVLPSTPPAPSQPSTASTASIPPGEGAGVPRDGPVALFARQLHQVLLARCEPLTGLVVVLAPTQVEEGTRWDDDLALLLDAPALREVRWALVDLDRPSAPRCLKRAGSAALAVECRVDPAAAQDDLARRIETAAGAPADASGLAQVGAAWPRGVAPPAPPGTVPMTPEAQAALAAKLGVPAGLFGGAIREVRPLVLRAALALRKGDTQKAVALQRDAAAKCAEAGLAREATLMELVLATYVVHAGQRPVAGEMYLACAQRAQTRGWADLAAQALMAAAALQLIDRERDRAAVLYARAATVARQGGEAALAIEAFRMAGHLRAEARDEDQATQLWTQAVAVATGLEPAAAGQTSAPTAARALAELCRKRGLKAQAAALDVQAAKMEAAR